MIAFIVAKFTFFYNVDNFLMLRNEDSVLVAWSQLRQSAAQQLEEVHIGIIVKLVYLVLIDLEWTLFFAA